MRIHTFVREDGQERHLLLDEEESIVDLPTRFCFSRASRARYSKASVREYMGVLKLFCVELSNYGYRSAANLDEALATMGPMIIEDWFVRLRSEGKSGYTLRTRDAVLKMFMEWLTTEEAGRVRQPTDHPYADGRLKTVAPHPPAPKYLTFREVSDFILYGVHDESQRCIIHFLFDTGVRVSELSRIRQADLPDISGCEDIMYFPLTIRGSKGRGGLIKQRYTIISRAMVVRLMRLHNNWRPFIKAQRRYSPEEMPAFLNVAGQPITAVAVQKQVQMASQRLRLLGRLSRNITPHCFRHGTALSILKSEHGREPLENLIVCQRAFGHTSIRTTENYTRIPAPVIARMRQFEAVEEFKLRYQEAEYIYENTFKQQRSHTERRGRHGKNPSKGKRK